ncbi:GNAT family N-acetyltransferase [Cellulomonas sp. P22]|uniref:GNAT family N-acetyltransferase n=1 Tax=Cellulomonas sp. P22 TaxID=3373189 RepID=UPI00379F445B
MTAPGTAPVTLRRFVHADGPATLDLFVRAIRVTARNDYSATQIAAWAPDDLDPAAWTSRRETSRTCVACVDGRVVGFTDVDGQGYVDMMFVDPDHGGRGVAGALLGWVVDVARREGVTELSTHASLTARPFFEAHGFVVERAQRPVLRGVELVNFVMRCPLRATTDTP